MKSLLLSSLSILFIISNLAACGGGGGGSGDDSSEIGEDSSLSSLQTLRIMPLGDSITQAEGGMASYRYWLWQFLISEGISADLVGGQSEVFQGRARFSDFDPDHQGHWDWHADQILANADSFASTNQPDVVLLHIGTNDMRRNESIDSTLNEIAQIIETFRFHNPNVAILLAQIIPSSVGNDRINVLNSRLPALVSSLQSESSELILVDQNTDFFLSSDSYDGVHPNQSGEQKIALRWLDALRQIL